MYVHVCDNIIQIIKQTNTMDIEYRLIKTLPRVKAMEIIMIMINSANKIEEQIIRIPFIPFGALAIRQVIKRALKNYAKRSSPKGVWKIIFTECMTQFANMYYANGQYIETTAYNAKDRKLISDLAYKTHKKREHFVRSPIKIENTNRLGFLKIELKAGKKVSFYMVECIKIVDNVLSKPIVCESMQTSTETIGGFESGALYMIRARPVFTKKRKGNWTPYFQIRVS